MKKETKWSLEKPLYCKPEDERYEKYFKQLKTRGFSDEETWGLNNVIAEFVLPRLKRFRELNNGYPNGFTAKTWYQTLDKMIFAFDSILREDEYQTGCYPKDYDYNFTTDENGVIIWKDKRKPNYTLYNKMRVKRAEGLKLFAEYFEDLWW